MRLAGGHKIVDIGRNVLEVAENVVDIFAQVAVAAHVLYKGLEAGHRGGQGPVERLDGLAVHGGAGFQHARGGRALVNLQEFGTYHAGGAHQKFGVAVDLHAFADGQLYYDLVVLEIDPLDLADLYARKFYGSLVRQAGHVGKFRVNGVEPLEGIIPEQENGGPEKNGTDQHENADLCLAVHKILNRAGPRLISILYVSI